MFPRQVETIQSIVVDEVVVVPGQQRLPLCVVACARIGLGRFHQHHPWTDHPPVDPAQHVGLCTFRINLEEVHLRHPLLDADRVEATHRNLAWWLHRQSCFTVSARKLRAGRGQAAVLHLEQVDRSFPGPRRHAQVDVARPLFDQHAMPVRHRLDVDSMPAQVVERLRHRIVAWMLGPHVYVESVHYAAQRAQQDHVFVVLRVRDETHDTVSSMLGATQAVPTKNGLSRFATVNNSARSRHS